MNYVQEVQEELKKHLKVGKGLTDYYTLLVLILGEETTLADVHDAWSVNINRTWDAVAKAFPEASKGECKLYIMGLYS